MKTLELNQMENIEAGGSNRGCLIAGFLAGVTSVIGLINPMAFIGTLAITSGAANAGCFD